MQSDAMAVSPQVKLAAAVIGAMPKAQGMQWFLKWETALNTGLDVTTLDPSGSGLYGDMDPPSLPHLQD